MHGSSQPEDEDMRRFTHSGTSCTGGTMYVAPVSYHKRDSERFPDFPS